MHGIAEFSDNVLRIFVLICRLFGFIARVPGVTGASFYCYIFECDTSGEPVNILSAVFIYTGNKCNLYGEFSFIHSLCQSSPYKLTVVYMKLKIK